VSLAHDRAVRCDNVLPIEQTHLDVACDQREAAVRRFGRHRVAIGVERHHGRLVGGCTRDEVGRNRGVRQREQTLLLVGEHFGDGALFLRRMRALHRDVFEEVQERSVAGRDRRDHARRKEARFEISNSALDATLVRRFAYPRGPQRNVQRTGEFDKVWLKADRAALTSRDDTLGVIEEPLMRDALEVLSSAHQRSEQTHSCLLEHEFCPHRARMTQQQHEAVQWTHATGHANVTDVRPIDLRLLARERLDPHVDFAWHLGSVQQREAAQCSQTTCVAALGDHVVDARRDKSRVALQRVEYEAAVWVEHTRTRVAVFGLRSEVADHSVDDIAVYCELGSDRAALPMLGEEQTSDLELGLPIDRHGAHSQLS
jgi:hypothetical protein